MIVWAGILCSCRSWLSPQEVDQFFFENLFMICFPVGAAFILKVILYEFISRRYLVLEQEDINQNYRWKKNNFQRRLFKQSLHFTNTPIWGDIEQYADSQKICGRSSVFFMSLNIMFNLLVVLVLPFGKLYLNSFHILFQASSFEFKWAKQTSGWNNIHPKTEVHCSSIYTWSNRCMEVKSCHSIYWKVLTNFVKTYEAIKDNVWINICMYISWIASCVEWRLTEVENFRNT